MRNHYHAMNGSSGCLPDSNELFTNRKDAVNHLCFMFDDCYERGMKSELLRNSVYVFSNSRVSGADYCEVASCNDSDCEEYFNE
jgi:hypothetical protein